MRVHLLSVPTCPVAPEMYPLDGFCFRTWAFAGLLKQLGHEVILYGVEGSHAPCDTFVSCVSETEWKGFLGTTPYQDVRHEPGSSLFLTHNTRAAQMIRGLKRPDDLIATIGGAAQVFVSEHHPELRFLEFSIGYRGVCAPYRIYESHAWRHVVHGYTGVDGPRAFDAVIYPWWDPDMFPIAETPEDYVAYCGRIQVGKGITTACRAAEQAGVKLVVVGHGDLALVTYGEHVGAVPNAERNRILSKARAVLMPTQYLEPFGNVAAEAQLCGTPVLGPTAGAFSETISHGVSGYHCATTGEYVQAIGLASSLDRAMIRARAERLFSTAMAARAYAAYFRRLDLARGAGIDSLDATLECYGPEQLYPRTDRPVESLTDRRDDWAIPVQAAAVA